MSFISKIREQGLLLKSNTHVVVCNASLKHQQRLERLEKNASVVVMSQRSGDILRA